MIGVYHVSVSGDDHDLLMGTLAQNLDPDQLPFVVRTRYDTTTCQVVLYDEQVMMLRLAFNLIVITKLEIKDEIDIPFENS